jgi:hypothetical protein
MSALMVMVPISESVPFQGDEGHHIWAARYFAHVFIDHDVSNYEFSDQFVGDGHYPWVVDHLMVGRYIIGGWLWLHGYDLYGLPPAYWHNKTLEQNMLEGRVPSHQLLADARRLMLVASGAIVILIYVIGRLVRGYLAGMAAALLLVSRPLIVDELSHVQLESIYICFMLAALVLWIASLRHMAYGQHTMLWSISLGILVGLAVATKLTALIAIASLMIWATLVAVSAVIVHFTQILSPIGHRFSRYPGVTAEMVDTMARSDGLVLARRCLMSLAITIAVALVILVASDPYLTTAPIEHSMAVLRYPFVAMQSMAPEFSDDVPNSLLDSVRFVGGSVFISIRALHGQAVNLQAIVMQLVWASVTLLGFLWLVKRGHTSWQRGNLLCTELPITIMLAISFLGITLSIGLLWPRYVLPVIVLSTIAGGIGCQIVVDYLWSAADRRRRRASRIAASGRMRVANVGATELTADGM